MFRDFKLKLLVLTFSLREGLLDVLAIFKQLSISGAIFSQLSISGVVE